MNNTTEQRHLAFSNEALTEIVEYYKNSEHEGRYANTALIADILEEANFCFGCLDLTEIDANYCCQECNTCLLQHEDSETAYLAEWESTVNQFTKEQQVVCQWVQDVMRQGDGQDHIEEIDRRIAEVGLTDEMIREYSEELSDAASRCF